MTFHITGARHGHTFSVVHPDGYQNSVALGGWGNAQNEEGTSVLNYMQGIAQINTDQPGWYL